MINSRDEMLRKRKQREQAQQRARRPLTEQEKKDRAILSVMKDWPLKPGQMLLLGPKSVAALTNRDLNAFDPAAMTDKYVLDKSEWA